MRVVVAIDSFKGCLGSAEANRAAAEGVRAACPEAEVLEVTVSDGGEGFIDAFRDATGGEIVRLTVKDPLMRDVEARYLLSGETAVLEVAEACGLHRLKPAERNPLVATSYGVGQLVTDALSRGAQRLIVGLGGSATSDAGRGMLRALKADDRLQMTDERLEMRDERLEMRDERCEMIVATDVDNPLCGENGAARVFGPQKGATPAMVAQLDAEARAFAEESARRMGFDRSNEPGAGAAGGLGYAFMQYLGAERRSGIDVLLETVGLDRLVQGADLILTGEGAADRQTLMGKLPTGVLRHAAGVPVCLLAGQVRDREALLEAGFAEVRSINPPDLPLEEALRPEVAAYNLRLAAQAILRNDEK